MTESDWVKLIAERIEVSAISHSTTLRADIGRKLPYAYEVFSYSDREAPKSHSISFETDLLIVEETPPRHWKPRVVLEAKVGSITTHDAITYSEKAAAHKAVHPYLRYGIIIGDRGHYPLPGRRYRHGQNFDFMISFQSFEPSEKEMLDFSHLIQAEIEASRSMEKIIYESRKRDRDRYTILHRRLELR